VTKAAEALNLLPPSGAIAGVYAAVDRDRGVWKAPANVSLNAVIGPAVKISQEQQGNYNIDVNAGKSINIIRSSPAKALSFGGPARWQATTTNGVISAYGDSLILSKNPLKSHRAIRVRAERRQHLGESAGHD